MDTQGFDAGKQVKGKKRHLLEALRKLPNDLVLGETVLRQAQHKREKSNKYKTCPVCPEPVEG